LIFITASQRLAGEDNENIALPERQDLTSQKISFININSNCCVLYGTEDDKKDVCSSGLSVFSPAFQAEGVVVCALRKSATCGYESIAFQAESVLYYFMMRLSCVISHQINFLSY
jgi:hypothetical protein